MLITNKEPFQILLELEFACKKAFIGLPSQTEVVQYWQGVSFKIGSLRCVSSMDEIFEIINEQTYTSLPGMKKWVKGVTNVRGRLIPVVDLAQFIDVEHATHPKSRRLIIVEFQDNVVGMIVSEVLGINHFSVLDYSEIANNIDSNISKFISGSFYHNNEEWLVFSLLNLFNDNEFTDISIIK